MSMEPVQIKQDTHDTQTKFTPLKIPQNQFSTMTNVNELHEFIKVNPNILDKNATQHITINKIYTDKNGINIHNDDNADKYEFEYKENSKNKNQIAFVWQFFSSS